MPQIFPRSANTIARMVIVGGPVLAGVFVVAAFAVYRSPVVTHVNIAKEQPIPFSHQRHVEGNGIDCRYCHTSVETGAFAGIPPTETCMTCHSQVLGDQPIFDPLYTSWETNEPIAWLRIHDVPDFVFFNHSIHVAQGVGCETCHGRIDKMPLTRKVKTLHMGWCLECHRQPEKFLRPRDEIFTMGYEPEESQKDMGARLLEDHGVEKGQLTNCSVCHR